MNPLLMLLSDIYRQLLEAQAQVDDLAKQLNAERATRPPEPPDAKSD